MYKPAAEPVKDVAGLKDAVKAEGAMGKQENKHNVPDAFYNDKVLDHFYNPRNVGEMTEGSCHGFSQVGDPECGDQVKLWIKVEDNYIKDVKFKAFGCPGAIATSSMATVMAKGKSLDDVKNLRDEDVVNAFKGIPEQKKHCSLLGITALHAAIEDYERKHK